MNANKLDNKKLTDTKESEYDAQFVGEKIGFSYQGQFYLMDQSGENKIQLTEIEEEISGVKAHLQKDGYIALLFNKSVKTEKKPEELYPNLPKADFKVIDDLIYRHWDKME